MGKYDNLKMLKETKARTNHFCYNCERGILPGEIYYREHIEDTFLHSLKAKKYCIFCFKKYGDKLLSSKLKNSQRNSALDKYL